MPLKKTKYSNTTNKMVSIRKWKKKILSLINKKNSLIAIFLNINKVNDFISSNKINTINNSNFLWQWLSLEYWYEEFFN